MFEGVDLLSGELDVECGDGIGEVVRPCRADDRGGDHRVLQHPGHRDLCHRHTACQCDALDGIDDGTVAFDEDRPVLLVDRPVQPRALRGALSSSGEVLASGRSRMIFI